MKVKTTTANGRPDRDQRNKPSLDGALHFADVYWNFIERAHIRQLLASLKQSDEKMSRSALSQLENGSKLFRFRW